MLTYLLGAMCDFLQVAFAQRPRGGLHFDPDEKQTELRIDSDAPFAAESRGDRPAIVVMMGPVSQMHMGMDDASTQSLVTGQEIKRVLMVGSFSLQCLSRLRAESQTLAWAAMDTIWANRMVLHKGAGFFQIGQNMSVGQTTPPGSLVAEDGGEGMVSTPVSVPFHFPWNVLVQPLNRAMLSSFEVEMRAKSHQPKGPPGVVPQSPLRPGVCAGNPYRAQPIGTPNVPARLAPITPPRSRNRGLPQPGGCVGTSETPLLVRFRVL